MAVERSDSAVLKYGTGKVGKIQSLSFTIAGTVIPANNFDSGGWAKKILGRRDVTMSVSGHLDREDTNGQNALRGDYLDATKTMPAHFEDFTIGPETPAQGDVSFTGAGFPSNYQEQRGDDGDGLATYTVEIQIDGPLTESTQT